MFAAAETRLSWFSYFSFPLTPRLLLLVREGVAPFPSAFLSGGGLEVPFSCELDSTSMLLSLLSVLVAVLTEPSEKLSLLALTFQHLLIAIFPEFVHGCLRSLLRTVERSPTVDRHCLLAGIKQQRGKPLSGLRHAFAVDCSPLEPELRSGLQCWATDDA